ncbi:hypothetical protein B0H13DRAFT_1867209 [Mycena leptocephala]|nr:hypothetical protein B0H13DRAFT_1867209 [Mycena leptocephala]
MQTLPLGQKHVIWTDGDLYLHSDRKSDPTGAAKVLFEASERDPIQSVIPHMRIPATGPGVRAPLATERAARRSEGKTAGRGEVRSQEYQSPGTSYSIVCTKSYITNFQAHSQQLRLKVRNMGTHLAPQAQKEQYYVGQLPNIREHVSVALVPNVVKRRKLWSHISADWHTSAIRIAGRIFGKLQRTMAARAAAT